MYAEATTGYAGQRLNQTIPSPALPADMDGPQIARVMERLGVCVSELGGMLNSLEGRLEPVLNQGAKVSTLRDEGAVPRPVRSPLGSAIDGQSDAVYAMTQRIRDVLERLAV